MDWSGPISGLLGIAQTALQARGQRLADERANKYAQQAQDTADSRNLMMWRKNNRYNAPSAQMERLREAGLNPNLMYGQGTVGNSSTQSPSKAAKTQASNIAPDIGKGVQTMATALQTDNLRAQNDVLIQEAAYKAAKTAESGMATAKSTFDLGLAKELRNTSLSAAQINLQKMQEEYYNLSAKGDSLRAQATYDWQSLPTRLKKVATDVKVAQANLKGKQLDNALSEYDKEIRIQYGIRPTDPLYYQLIGKALKAAGLKFN